MNYVLCILWTTLVFVISLVLVVPACCVRYVLQCVSRIFESKGIIIIMINCVNKNYPYWVCQCEPLFKDHLYFNTGLPSIVTAGPKWRVLRYFGGGDLYRVPISWMIYWKAACQVIGIVAYWYLTGWLCGIQLQCVLDVGKMCACLCV